MWLSLLRAFWGHCEGATTCEVPSLSPSAVASARQATCKCFCVLLWDLQQSPKWEIQSKQVFCTLVKRQRMKGINAKIMSTASTKLWLLGKKRVYKEHMGSLKGSVAQVFKRTVLRYKHSPLCSTSSSLSQLLLGDHNVTIANPAS